MAMDCLHMVSLSRDWDRIEKMSAWGKSQELTIENLPAYSLEEAESHLNSKVIHYYFIDATNLPTGDLVPAMDQFSDPRSRPMTGILVDSNSPTKFSTDHRKFDQIFFDNTFLGEQLGVFYANGIRRAQANVSSSEIAMVIDAISDQLTILVGMSWYSDLDKTENPAINKKMDKFFRHLNTINNQLSELKSLLVSQLHS